jgi:hypothetical protein
MSLPNGARLRLIAIDGVCLWFQNAELNKKDNGLFPTRHLDWAPIRHCTLISTKLTGKSQMSKQNKQRKIKLNTV